MVQRFLEAVQIYTMYIYLCLYFICPPLYFCFQAFLDCDSTRGTSSWVLQRLLQGSRDWNRNRNRDRSTQPTHLFASPPTRTTRYAYKICFVNKVMPLQTNWTLCPCFIPIPLALSRHCCTGDPWGNRSGGRRDDWRNMWLTFEPLCT